jgi:SAM-dependent methyltransferase
MSFYSEFAVHYEAVFPFREKTYAFLKRFVPPGGKRILDAGCGPGHYCGRFAAEDFEALGVDLDARMIAAAKSRYPGAEFIRLDLNEVSRLRNVRPFDLVFCLGNVAAHLRPEEFKQFMGQVRDLLKPAGRWIFQVVNWDDILTRESYQFPTLSAGEPDITFSRSYEGISERGLWFRTCLRRSGEKLFEDRIRLYPMPSAACITMHRRAGFELVGHFADFDGTPFDGAAGSASIYVFEPPGPA